VTARVKAEQEKENLIGKLKEALSEIKTLSGLIPICSSCKKIRDDQGYWNSLEVYMHEHTDASFSHSYCPECIKREFPEVYVEGKFK
ncbi:MAG: sensor with HAMP domain protein, partial [Calditrichaeota bacterium]|nr:sensor with HAMP domain protein [Calditrichota bacterium]